MVQIGIDELDQKIVSVIKAKGDVSCPDLCKEFPETSAGKIRYRVNTLSRDGWIRAVKTRGILKCYPTEA